MRRNFDSDQNSQVWWWPIWEFGTHVTVGTGLFILIAAPAVSLNFLVKYLSFKGIEIYIIVGLQVAKYALFAADIFLFLVFLLRATTQAYRAFGEIK